MASDRLQRRLERLLDEAEEAITQLDWRVVHDRAQAVLAIDPENSDGLAFLATAERALANSTPRPTGQPVTTPPTPTQFATPDQPTSFANGRYQVKQLLGEGGKKKVYLTHDTTLDRDVAFALIKSEALDEVSRTMGNVDGKFRSPQEIAADDAGNIYVFETGKTTVQVFDTEGQFLRRLTSLRTLRD